MNQWPCNRFRFIGFMVHESLSAREETHEVSGVFPSRLRVSDLQGDSHPIFSNRPPLQRCPKNDGFWKIGCEMYVNVM